MNPILLRKQLQENASDLQDFCKDLQNWGEEMKRKEETLKNGDSGKTSGNKSDHKRVRTNGKDKISKESKKEITAKKPTTKIGVTDYAAWDKFDADVECEKLEDNQNEDSELTDECDNNKLELAIVEKEKGNKFVKSQNWDEAIKCYSKAIEYYSYDPIFYANRALCHLKKENFIGAEQDCSLSLKLDNTYVKAYQRRAAAWMGLTKFLHAEHDLMRVLELEPKNKESRESLEKLRKKLGNYTKIVDQRPVSKFTASRNKSNINTRDKPVLEVSITPKSETETESEQIFDTSKPVPVWPEDDNIILVNSTNKPPHLRSKKPLRRIRIVEKDGIELESKIKVKSEPEAVKQHVFEKQKKTEPPKQVSSVENEESPTGRIEDNVSSFKKRQAEKISEKSEHPTAWPKPDQETLSIRSSDFKIIEKEPPDLLIGTLSANKEVKNTPNVDISKQNKQIVVNITNTGITKPKSSVQFNLTWKNLRNTEEKYEFLKQVEPSELPRIFLNSLESTVFSEILEVLALHFIENKDPVFDVLYYFTEVKRFGTFTMFMSLADKRNLWKLFDYVREFEQKNKEDVDRLVEKYEL